MAATEYNTGFDDAQSVNNSTRDNFLYKDISLYFTRNPVTSDVTTVTDIQDIKRAVRHIVLLNPGEKPFHPEIGTGVRAALFQNFTAPIKALLSSRIQEQLRKYESRIEVTNVSFNDNIDNNELSCKIEFNVRNAPQQTEEVDIFLQRLR
jgi:phage baseplate assembly protein W